MEAARNLDVIRAGPLEVRPGESLALAGGQPLTLSVREFGVLVALAQHAGRILSREQLYALVWGDELRAGDRSVDVYVHKLRAKLEAELPEWRFIHTHVGFGYRFSSEPLHGFHTQPGEPQDTEEKETRIR
jgi:DNA-binding response OmpR family regulator